MMKKKSTFDTGLKLRLIKKISDEINSTDDMSVMMIMAKHCVCVFLHHVVVMQDASWITVSELRHW